MGFETVPDPEIANRRRIFYERQGLDLSTASADELLQQAALGGDASLELLAKEVKAADAENIEQFLNELTEGKD